MTFSIHGLVAATHTPFDVAGKVNLAGVECQAQHMVATGVGSVFIGGSTGESHSLTVEERLALAQRWSEVVRGTALQLIVHVGSNCLADASTLAAQAQSLGAAAISAVAPSYFKPKSIDDLVASCRQITDAAPQTPFYFYDIPSMTGLHLPMSDFLAVAAQKLPSLVGIKFSNPDQMMFQKCKHAEGGRFDILWGIDEYLLSAVALGALGAVGSTYNFAAPIYSRMLSAFERRDLATARTEQFRSVQIVELLSCFGYMPAAKAVMGMLGVDVGSPRLPNATLTADRKSELRTALDRLGFFAWVRP